MLSVDVVIMLVALAFFFWRAGVQADRDEGQAAVTVGARPSSRAG
jgi:nitrogen fixation-related uncharacterized protein